MDWPIETAPKDGTRILLFGTAHADGANSFDTEPLWIVGKYDGGWWEADPYDYYPIEISPMRWMPLPAPPSDS